MDFEKLASQLSVLNRPEKLKILALLIEEGQKSITDISKELKINFSTAHKYLEQLEAAGLVWSKTIKEDRIKRLFFAKDFNISLSTKSISQEVPSRVYNTFKVINEEGEEGFFDEQKFTKRYYEAGVPKSSIESGIKHITASAYNGITVLELRSSFNDFLQDKVVKITNALDQTIERDVRKRTILSVLRLLAPNIIKQHLNGGIFISNLRKPCIRNFVYDIRAIGLHGIAGERAKTAPDILKQTLSAFDIFCGLGVNTHCLDSFNYMLAPYSGLTKEDIIKFIKALDEKKKNVFIALDVGVPKFSSEIPTDFWSKPGTGKTYDTYSDKAKKISEDVISAIKESNSSAVPIFKVWDNTLKDLPALKNCFVANMLTDWQTANASYIGSSSRFDCSWKQWMATVRVGEIENIAINLPRLALQSKKEDIFFEQLEQLLTEIISSYQYIVELTLGAFLELKESWLKSAQTERWRFIPVEDFQYSISVFGLNEAIRIITGEDMIKQSAFATKVIKFCNEQIAKTGSLSIRLALKEEFSNVAINRMSYLDSKLFGERPKYSSGVSCPDPNVSASLHKYLLGGHCVAVSREQLNKLKEFGLAKVF